MAFEPPFFLSYPYGLELAFMVDRAARAANVQLSWGARALLTIPVIEAVQSQGSVDLDEVNSSINAIVASIAEEPELNRREKTADSVSVIGAFHRRFCNIPPFCSRTDRRRE